MHLGRVYSGGTGYIQRKHQPRMGILTGHKLKYGNLLPASGKAPYMT